MSKTAPNTRLPYLCLYVTEHAARVARLSLAERGMLDLVRCELWAVDGFKLPREHLERRLRVRPGTQDADHLQALFDDCLLQVDEQGCPRRSKSEPLCRSNIEPGLVSDQRLVSCG
jgi:hypothetical protein